MMETVRPNNYFILAQTLALFATIFFGTISAASAEGLFSARGISVDVTASSANEAREIAISEAQVRAFNALLRKLTPETYHTELPSLPETEIAGMVTGVQVKNEKTSATRYLADFTVDFNRERILPLLRARDIPYAESISKPILVLPVYEDKGTKNLWDEPNPWRDAWIDIFDNRNGPEGNLQRQDDWAQIPVLPVRVPVGTLDDMKAVTVEDAIYLREEPIRSIAEEYGASAVMVAYASLQNNNGIRRLDISYQRSDMLTPAVVESFTGGDTDEEIFRAAIFDMFQNLQEGWKDQNILDRSVENKLAVSTTINSLKDWVDVKTKTSEIPAIQQVKVREISVGNVFWEIEFVGNLSQLRQAFAQKSLVLDDAEGYWTLNKQGLN
ncbi:DUF2066 domain-containing protein [Sneathiella limimaris]|uniref:DUF2066 domain-containing protein n=1 Tax=Sneathiella limimaris TaxID=1964213 RepID=UPI00146A1D81|nr:DUF2066 domain-containing protein [Sneathiella limimaris]